jgi:protein NrfD
VTNARPPYGRSPDAQPDTPTYYGLPALKSSHYGWLVVTYLFVGGLAGASQLIATLADLVGGKRERVISRYGRYLALAGSLACPLFLIKDLHTPSRWYNMLRIFRATSPMSIGSWILTIFGTFSGLAALGQAIQDLTDSALGPRLARRFGPPAGLVGAMMSVYTGTLLSATSVPLWSTAPRLLPALFAVSAAGTANAAISLMLEIVRSPKNVRRQLHRFALVLSGLELAVSFALRRHWRRLAVDSPLQRPTLGLAYRLGASGLGLVIPLAAHTLQLSDSRQRGAVSALASLSTLAGGYILRAVIVFAGNLSARRPEDYFRITAAGPSFPTADPPVHRPA